MQYVFSSPMAYNTERDRKFNTEDRMPVFQRIRNTLDDLFFNVTYHMDMFALPPSVPGSSPSPDWDLPSSSMGPELDPSYSTEEVATYIMAGEEKKACSMIRHCSCFPNSKVWQRKGSPYCEAVHPYVPHLPDKPCSLCTEGGMYVPLINLACYMKSNQLLTTMLRVTYNKVGSKNTGDQGGSSDVIVGYEYSNYENSAQFYVTSHDSAGFQPAHVAIIVGFESGLKEMLNRMTERDFEYYRTQNPNPVVLAILKQSGVALSELCRKLNRSHLERPNPMCSGQYRAHGIKYNALQLVCKEAPTWIEGMEILLACGVDPNVRDFCDHTPLFTAVEQGRQDVVQLLVKYNADIDHVDSNGRTPLHYSFSTATGRREEDCTLMMKCLLELGADQFIEDNGHLLPVEKAIKFHGLRCVELLLRSCRPMDLLLLSWDLKLTVQFRNLHKRYKRCLSIRRPGQQAIHDMLGQQLQAELSLWLWTTLWCIVGTGRYLAPILYKTMTMLEMLFDEEKEEEIELEIGEEFNGGGPGTGYRAGAGTVVWNQQQRRQRLQQQYQQYQQQQMQTKMNCSNTTTTAEQSLGATTALTSDTKLHHATHGNSSTLSSHSTPSLSSSSNLFPSVTPSSSSTQSPDASRTSPSSPFTESTVALYRYVRALVEEYRDAPLSLRELCRFKIRYSAVDVRDRTLHELPLPRPLVRYLLFQDVDRVCEEIRGKELEESKK